ncbi:MAG: type II toxin-antitoxin system RelE/ParE family toxin [Desulfobulbaceae bacterium]|nr:MAG: type II toxin-antitoxin system RelE/ParE family toxin [Desulfobulbaceae bacterium]
MKLKWSETAIRDLLSIRRYIVDDNPAAANNWIARLRTRAGNTVHAPLAGRKVPELCRDDVREVIEGNYRIVYQVHNDHVTVLTVFEAHRLFPTKNAI